MLKWDNGNLVFVTVQILLQVLSVTLIILAKSYNKDQANTWQLFNISFVFKIQRKSLELNYCLNPRGSL